MAIIVDQNKKKAELDPNKAMTPTTTMGSTVSPQTPAQQKTPSSGQFTNLKNYLQGNVKAGQNIANKLLGTVEPTKAMAEKNIQETQKAGQDINTQAQQFRQGAQAVSSFLTPGSTEQTLQNPQKAFTTEQIMSGQVDTGFGAAQQKEKQASSNLADLQEKNRMLAGETGRQQLLKNLYNNPNYRTGLSTLDQAFLQQQAGNKLQEATTGLKQFGTQKASDLQNYLEQARQRSEAFGKTAEETSKSLKEQLEKSATEISGIQDKQLTDINKKVGDVNRLLSGWTSGNLDVSTLNDSDKQLLKEALQKANLKTYGGIDPNTGKVIETPANIDAKSYLTWGAVNPLKYTGTEQYGLKDVVSKAEANRIDALKKLSGGNLLQQYEGMTGSDESALTPFKGSIDSSAVGKARDEYYRKKAALAAARDEDLKATHAQLLREGFAPQLMDNVIEKDYQDKLTQLMKTITTLRKG